MSLSTHLIGDTTAKVSFQILSIVPATVKDDPSKKYDWRWAWNMEATCHDVPGELIQLMERFQVTHMHIDTEKGCGKDWDHTNTM